MSTPPTKNARDELFAEMLSELAPGLTAFALKQTRSPERAKELLQRAIVWLLAKIAAGAYPEAWPPEAAKVGLKLRWKIRSLNDKRSGERRRDDRVDTIGVERDPDEAPTSVRYELTAPESERSEALIEQRDDAILRKKVLELLPAAVAGDAALSALLAIQIHEGHLSLAEKAKRLGTDKNGYIALNKRLERAGQRVLQELLDEER